MYHSKVIKTVWFIKYVLYTPLKTGRCWMLDVMNNWMSFCICVNGYSHFLHIVPLNNCTFMCLHQRCR